MTDKELKDMDETTSMDTTAAADTTDETTVDVNEAVDDVLLSDADELPFDVDFYDDADDADVALVEPGHPHDGADERRFARAVMTDESEDVARHHLKRHAVHRALLAERLHHLLHRKHGGSSLALCIHGTLLSRSWIHAHPPART